MKKNFTTSETFLSIEGEGPYSGFPTIYARFTNCNFTCSGFNNPDNVDPASHEVLGFNPADLSTVNEIPSINVGCDSIYSWHRQFKHMWTNWTAAELAEQLTSLLPESYNRKWVHPVTNQPVILSLTGGEPTLRLKNFVELLSQPQFNTLTKVLIETNGSVVLREADTANLYQFQDNRRYQSGPLDIIWSFSPKLSASGESFNEAINPEALFSTNMFSRDNEFYLKFVCGASNEHFNEVAKAVNTYADAFYKLHEDAMEFGPCFDPRVYIMPMCCTEDQQTEIAQQVADMCIERGYIYCHRVHNTVYNNAIGK